MDALTLLEKARAAGLRVKRDGERLVVEGPRSLEGLATQLLDHKAEIVALLATTCEDCRPSHTQPVACEGRPFRVGAVMATAPGDYKVAIHCPVCCPARGKR